MKKFIYCFDISTHKILNTAQPWSIFSCIL